MFLSKFVKSGIVLYFSLFFADSLKPIKLPSGQDRIYKYNRRHPEFVPRLSEAFLGNSRR